MNAQTLCVHNHYYHGLKLFSYKANVLAGAGVPYASSALEYEVPAFCSWLSENQYAALGRVSRQLMYSLSSLHTTIFTCSWVIFLYKLL